MLHNSKESDEQKLADKCASAAKNLQECRTRHGTGNILDFVAVCALTNGDTELMKRVQSWEKESKLCTENHFTRAVRDFNPGKRAARPHSLTMRFTSSSLTASATRTSSPSRRCC